MTFNDETGAIIGKFTKIKIVVDSKGIRIVGITPDGKKQKSWLIRFLLL